MSLEDFKNLAGGIQSLLVGLAVLIGGAWTLFRFFSLKEVEKAKRDLQQQSHLRLEMQATQMFSSNRVDKYINVSLTITNPGNRTELIRWLDSKLSAALVSKGTNGGVQLGERISAKVQSLHLDLKGSTIDPGISETCAFLIPVESYGVYFLESSLAGSAAETNAAIEEAISAGFRRPDLAYWAASMYFNVIEPMDDSPNKTKQPLASSSS